MHDIVYADSELAISTLDTWHCKIIHAIASRSTSVLIEYKLLVLNNKCMCDIIIIMFPCLLLTCEHNSIHCMWTEIAGRLYRHLFHCH